MKLFYITIIVINIFSCSKNESFRIATTEIQILNMADKKISAETIKKPLLYNTVESSIINEKNNLEYFYDFGMKGSMYYKSTDTLDQYITSGKRFSYVFKLDKKYFNVYEKNGSLYLDSSYNKINWVPENNGEQILSKDSNPSSIYNNLWNASIAVDSNNKWNIFVECSDEKGNANAGISHMVSEYINGKIEFNSSKKSQLDIEKAGNPDFKYVPNLGVVGLIGKMMNGYWVTTFAKLNNDNTMNEYSNKYKIYSNNSDICDPAFVEINNEIILNVSVDQYFVYQLKIKSNLSDVFTSLDESL